LTFKILLLTCSFIFTHMAQAKPARSLASNKKATRLVKVEQAMKLNYKNKAWNQSNQKIDSGQLLLRDIQSGFSVIIDVYETTPNSGEFTSRYLLSWGDLQEVSPEVYTPSKGTQISDSKSVDFNKLASDKKLTRAPFIYHRDANGDQVIDSFGSREEAEGALKKYKEELKNKIQPSDAITEEVIDESEAARIRQEVKKMEEEAPIKAAERESLLAKLRQKVDQQKKEFSSLPTSQRNAQRAEAKKISDEAMEAYRNNQLVPSEEGFRKSMQLDPNVLDYYFYYGVVLNKLDRPADSLIYLEYASRFPVKTSTYNPLEGEFYKGVNYYKLNEYTSALKKFQEIKAKKDPTTSPMAAFYEGIVLFQLQKFEESKASFQEVLDTSQDPNLDQRAEDFIENIERTKMFLKQKNKKWFFTASGGLEFDSNVLAVNSSTAGSADPTNVGDNRWITGGSIEYRAIYEKTHEFSIKSKIDMLYSTKESSAAVDPLVYNFTAPFKYKSQLFGKGYKLEITPGYEILNLDEDSSGANKGFISSFEERQNYLNSTLFNIANTLVISDKYFAGLTFKYRHDSSASPTTVNDNDTTANKYTISTNHIYFLNDKKNVGLIGDTGYTRNSSFGKNYTYNRFDLSSMLLFPAMEGVQGIFGLAYYYAQYPDKSTAARYDNSTTYSLNFSKNMSSWLTATLGGSYNTNYSNNPSNQYFKYVILGVLTANWSL